MDLLTTFATDPRTGAICLLILCDLLTGVAAAIRQHTFAGERVWAFLGTDILRFLGYAALYGLTALGLLAPLQALGVDLGFGENATVWGLVVISVGSLLTSIRKNTERATGWVLFPRATPQP